MRTSNSIGWSVQERGWAAVVTLGVVGAALVPFRQYLRPVTERVDGFPLSYYPMFSARRGVRGGVIYAVGVRADGSRVRIPHHMLGPGGVNQVRKQLSRAVARGSAERHVAGFAERLAQSEAGADLVRVEIVRGEFDLDACLMSRQVDGDESVLCGADVQRPGPAPIIGEETTGTPIRLVTAAEPA